ncbi:class I SAM-dependent methyltransferase [Pseudonocardia asaccharolytica]|uniref:Uncharacterized protein n=1 Tax=Pseudonocardia asaccharolytica DSM 44247 = NBRC 16224 TaxID=1123024 RepID=A0A511CW69_9PSEU|nr:class I SAM-dependent methyltransferase [Pseudonocardia asaccharolytica]GEL16483.1 hypothetical protein PA7_03200 [Pseudonocardia asaccharolytica DSM 44247 = NBRC 16224]
MSTQNDEDHATAMQLESRPPLRWYVRMVRRYLGPGPYLDFGCGSGQLLRRLARHGPASGFEISEQAARAARENAPGYPVSTSMDQLPDGAFRGVVAIHVLERLDDVAAAEAVRTWRRVLRPGGRVLLVVTDPGGRGRELGGTNWSGFADPMRINLKPHARWRTILTDAGFRIVREGSDGLWDVPYGRMPKLLDLRAAPAVTQFVLGHLLVAPGSGESSVFVLEKTGCRTRDGGR